MQSISSENVRSWYKHPTYFEIERYYTDNNTCVNLSAKCGKHKSKLICWQNNKIWIKNYLGISNMQVALSIVAVYIGTWNPPKFISKTFNES